MSKIWQVLPKIEEDFIKKYPEYSPVVLQLLQNRGLKTEAEIKEFLEPDYEAYSHDPFLFNDMEKAVELIIAKVKAGEKIIIYGDYDADGVTSSVILVEILSLFKAQVESYIPSRVDEGYGLNKEAISEVAKKGASLIVTVDCGIRSKKEVEFAKSLGLDVIITDHHSAPDKPEDYPDCLIICPSLPDERYPFKYLAGVGVAFKLALALIRKSKLKDEQKIFLEKRILEMTAIGTVSDCVRLLGENRVIVKKGMEELNKTGRLGLRKLLEVAQIGDKVLDTWNIGFQIGPRINAAGRMDHANHAYVLFTTKDESEAIRLASKLNNLNADRQKITEEIMAEVEKQIQSDAQENLIVGICESSDEAWSEGVTGLVAGKICEKYYRPTLVITKTEDGYKGSGRSIEEFNIIEAVESCREFLEKYGGHPAACGFSFKEENKENFLKKIKTIANQKLKDSDLKPKVYIEADIDIQDVGENLYLDIQKFAPFGQNNQKPKFLSSNVQIKDIMTMGYDGQHIKFRLNGLWALSFNGSENWKEFNLGDSVDMVYYIDKNEFNGRSELQLKIVDMKKNNSNDTNKNANASNNDEDKIKSDDEDFIIHKDLSYKIVGLLYETNKELGVFRNEKQYADFFEKLLKRDGLCYVREYKFKDNKLESEKIRCICDFIIDDKIILEFKAKDFITKEDYYQVKRYLVSLNYQLGILVNFRQNRLCPKRVLNSEYLKNK